MRLGFKSHEIKFVLLISFACALLPAATLGHHGVASLGVAGLMGPGAPIESSSSATLPEGKSLGYFKVDHARFVTYSPEEDSEIKSNSFLMAGAGYGFASYFSAYIFAPYNIKKTEDNSYNTAGNADISLMAVVGFVYDDTLHLTPATESLDDMEEWHFTVYSGGTLPTGNSDLRNSQGEIDPGMSTGFGSPSYSMGMSATKPFGRLTWITDVSYISFDPHRYSDGMRVRFGDESRLNFAFTYRGYVNEQSKIRIDPVMEFNFVKIGRDKESGIRDRDMADALASAASIPLPAEPFNASFPDSLPPWRWQSAVDEAMAGYIVPEFDPWGLYASSRGVSLEPSGGEILYLLPGVRFYKESISMALGIKIPVWTQMNKVSSSKHLTMAYLQGNYSNDLTNTILDAYWEKVALSDRLNQGSEGRERYRLQFSASFLI